ncbi:transporter substrate-binding domain-containing protein [Pseudomonas sp. sp1636]|uniref:substrate-binding periplasmic protein n=1 Tax=Pseudomonas sp. sp1636 TaxID=3036707 RepID=UPI0025A64537|nr:transporter substrate-binding domain-containing protein [Pseudomonas sp. sp1636]MDM8349399.1 transporter substrate-binding domain-containing protein [Pseudomonas sp. sp1636]
MQWMWGMALLWFSLMTVAEPLRLGIGTHKPPYVFQGEARGLEYEIVAAAAEHAGFTVQVSYAPMERLHLLLRRGEIDAIATTNEQSGIAAFYSEPHIYYQNVAVALRARNYQITRIADLGRYSVSAFQRARFLLGSEFQRMALNNPRYREEARQIARNRLLYSGRIEVVVADMRILRYLNREVLDQVDVSQPLSEYRIFAATPYQVGFCREAQRDRFNQGLAAIRANGEYRAIERRYAMY